jgi:hypothetical protein
MVMWAKVLYQIFIFGADLKFNMTVGVHNVFSLAEILKIFLLETTKPIELLLSKSVPWFQRRFKCEKLTDGRRRQTDA